MIKKMGFVTKNEGKYYSLKSLLESNKLVEQLIWLNQIENVIEGDNVHENSNNKSLEGSKLVDYPVIATDEALFLDFLPGNEQPGAYVKRMIGDNPTDKEVINFYSRILKEHENAEGAGRIITSFSISINSSVVSNMEYVQECLFRLPASQNVVKGRPLASLHYINDYGKHYSELNQEQEKSLNDVYNSKIISFIKSTKI